MAKYYSVRESRVTVGKYKVVLAGGFLGYEDIDLPLFDSFKEACDAAYRLEELRLTKSCE